MWRCSAVLIGCILGQAIGGTILMQQELPKKLMEHVQYAVQEVPQTIHVVDKPYPVYVPQPYTVYVEKKVPHEMKVPVAKHFLVEKRIPFHIMSQTDKHHPVDVIKAYKVYVEKRIPYYMEKHVPYKVKIPIEKRYPLHYQVEKEVPYAVIKEVPYEVKVPVEKPVPYKVEKPVPHLVEKLVPYPVVKEVPFPVNVPYKVEIKVPYKVKLPNAEGNSEGNKSGGFSQQDSFGPEGGWRPLGSLSDSSIVENSGSQHSKAQEYASTTNEDSGGLGQYYESAKYRD